MSVNENLGGGPGVSAFFNGKELEADAQLEQEQITNEFHNAITSELQDLFKDFSETLSDEEILDESQTSSHFSLYEQNPDSFIKKNKPSPLSPPSSTRFKSQSIPDSLNRQHYLNKVNAFESRDTSEAGLDHGLRLDKNTNHEYDYSKEFKNYYNHKNTVQDISGSFLSLPHAEQAIGNTLPGSTENVKENFPHSVNRRDDKTVSGENPQKYNSTGKSAGKASHSDPNPASLRKSNPHNGFNDEWMLQIQNPKSASHHYYPVIYSNENITTGRSVEKFPFHNEASQVDNERSSSPTLNQDDIYAFRQSHANSSSPPPLPSTAPPSLSSNTIQSSSKQVVNQKNDASNGGDFFNQYKVHYVKGSDDVGEEQFYIQSNQIEFFHKDLPEERRTYEQLSILYKARGREIEELNAKFEEKEEEMGKEIRSLKHKLALATGNAEGSSESLKNCKQLLLQAQSDNAEASGKIRALESQLTSVRDSKEELLKKLQSAESTIGNLTHYIEDLQNSDSLSRVRIDHENMISSMTQRYERELLGIKEKLDETKTALEYKQEEIIYLKNQLADTTQELERNQISRADTINRLAKSLEDSQRQYQAVLEQTSTMDMTTLKIQLQQSQASKKLSDDLCRTFQSEIKELKEQLNMYESASSLGVFTASHFPGAHDDSMSDLGIRKTLDFSTPKSNGRSEISKTSDDLIASLKTELEKCIRNNKQKRAEVAEKLEQIKSLEEDLDEAKRRISELEVTCSEQKQLLERTNVNTGSEMGSIVESRLKKDIENLKKEKSLLLEDLEEYKKRLEEIGSSEARLAEINQELSQQISQMVNDFDADKRAALDRCQRTLEEVHRMSVETLRSDIEARYLSEKSMAVEQYTVEIKNLKKQLESALSELQSVKAMYSKLCEEYEYHETELAVKFKAQLEKELSKVKKEYELDKTKWEESLKNHLKKDLEKEAQEEKEKAEMDLKAFFKKDFEAKMLKSKQEWDETYKIVKDNLVDLQQEKELWILDKKNFENLLAEKEREIFELKEKMLILTSSHMTNQDSVGRLKQTQVKVIEYSHETSDLDLSQDSKSRSIESIEVPLDITLQADQNGSGDLLAGSSGELCAVSINKSIYQTEEIMKLKDWLKERDAMIEDLQLKLASSKLYEETGDENRNCVYQDITSFSKTSDSLLVDSYMNRTIASLHSLSGELLGLSNSDKLSKEEMKEVITKLKEGLKSLECKLISVQARHELELDELKLQHKKEFEKAAQTREEKFQNELKYFLKDREDRAKHKMDQVLRDYELKSKVELDKAVHEIHLKHSFEIQQLTSKFEEKCRSEVKKAVGECEEKVREKLEKETQGSPEEKGELNKLIRKEIEKELRDNIEKELRDQIEKKLRDEIENEFSSMKMKLETENSELKERLDKSEENKCSELTLLSRQFEQVVIKLKEENEEQLLKVKSDYMKEMDKLNHESKSEGSNAKKNLLNLLERERDIEDAVSERVKVEVERMKGTLNREEIERQLAVQLQQQKSKWLEEARVYIYGEIKQGVENKLEEERKKLREEANTSEKQKQEELDRAVKDKLEVERCHWNKILEDVNRQKDEEINKRVKERVEVEREKFQKQLEEVGRNNEEEVSKKVKEKLATEFETLKKKFVTELNARVLKEKSRLEEEVQTWRDEVKRKLEEDRAKFINQMSEELEEKVLEERKKMEEEMRMVMEGEMKEMREELEGDMRQRLQRERKEWEEEAVKSGRMQMEKQTEQEWKVILRSEIEARTKACKERDTAVEFIKSVEARHLEEKQKLRQCIDDLEQVKKEHNVLEEKCQEMDRRYKADMKEAKRKQEKEQAKVVEKEEIIVRLKKQLKEIEDDYQLYVDKLKTEVREEKAKMLIELEAQAKLAIDETIVMMPEVELKEQCLDIADKMKAAFVSIIQSSLHSHTLKYKNDVLEVFRDKCKACVRTSLSGLVQVSCISELEESIDKLADQLISPKTYSARRKPSQYDAASHKKHSPSKVRSVIKRVNEKAANPKIPHVQGNKEAGTPQSHFAHNSGDGGLGQQQAMPHLDQVELDETFYQTPTNSNNSSPAGNPRSRSHTQSLGMQHVQLPDTPDISPKHLVRSSKLLTPSVAEHDLLSERSPRDAMKVMEARIRLANWACSGETPWKSSKQEKNLNFQSSYVSFDDAHKLPEKEQGAAGVEKNKLEKDIDGFVKPGVDAVKWVKLHREKSSRSNSERLMNKAQSSNERYQYLYDDSDDTMSSDGQASLHTLNRCNLTEDEDDLRQSNTHIKVVHLNLHKKNSEGKQVEKRMHALTPAREGYKSHQVNLSNESISSTETDHFPLYGDQRPSSTPLVKIKSSQAANKLFSSKTPDVYEMQCKTVQPERHTKIQSGNLLRKSADLPFSFASYSEPHASLQRYKSLEDLLPRRNDDEASLRDQYLVTKDEHCRPREAEMFYNHQLNERKVNFKPYPIKAMTASFWDKQSFESVIEPNHQELGRRGGRYTPLEARPFSSQDKF